MNTTIRTNSARVTVLMVLLSVLFVLTVAFAVQQVAGIGDRDAGPASSAKVPGLTEDPYIERHADIIARYHGGSLR